MRKDLIVVCLILGATLSAQSNAYLDPGTGSYVLQMVIAGVLGGLFTVKSYWRVLKAKISNRS